VKKTSKKKSGSLSRRLSFPDDEKRLPWLPLLLDSYAVADTGVAVAMRDEQKKHGKKPACGKGCGNCCAHQKDLPVYPHELVGIYWYVSEKMESPFREHVRNRLEHHVFGAGCPFLVEGSCSIHPVRPIGCRQFNVFTRPCEPGEDPYYTRRQDVLVPLSEYTDRAFAAVLPFYNLKKEGDQAASIKLVRAQIMNLQTYDWKKLVEAMDKSGSAEQVQVKS
jgi:Fe-S-cluster containining protein